LKKVRAAVQGKIEEEGASEMGHSAEGLREAFQEIAKAMGQLKKYLSEIDRMLLIKGRGPWTRYHPLGQRRLCFEPSDDPAGCVVPTESSRRGSHVDGQIPSADCGGHTDSRGSEAHNMALSQRWAESVPPQTWC
jgi:hypothetical protein